MNHLSLSAVKYAIKNGKESEKMTMELQKRIHDFMFPKMNTTIP